MANSITNNIITIPGNASSTKPSAMKESMEWKNIFDKSMFEMFQKTELKATFQQNTNEAYAPKLESDKTADDVNRANKAAVTNESANKEVNGIQDKGIKGNGDNAQQSGQINLQTMPSYGITQILQPVDSASLKLAMTANSNGNNQTLQTFTSKIPTPSAARVHFTITEEGLKVYARNNELDDESMIEMVKDLIGMFNHREYAIHEIVYNGKTITI